MAHPLLGMAAFGFMIYGIYKFHDINQSEKPTNKWHARQRNLAQSPKDMLHVRDGGIVISVKQDDPFMTVDRLTGLLVKPIVPCYSVMLDSGQVYCSYTQPDVGKVLNAGSHNPYQ